MLATLTSPLVEQLERDGFAHIPDLLGKDQLHSMQRAFAARLQRMRWNDVDGYEINERYRLMVPNLLTLDQGFVDAALDPRVTETARAYVGPNVELCEAKGWQSNPTHYDFHGWHGDMWYAQDKVDYIPRELKLGIYLTEVKSGAFKYVKGTHGKQHPRNLKRGEADQFDPKDIVEVLGPAGSAFIFDTSGVHRQSIPILEERHAFFLTYHDPNVPLQPDDVEYYRYAPLILNAAFLGNLSQDDQKMLGFGNKTNYCPHHQRQTVHTGFHRLMSRAFAAKIVVGEFRRRIFGKLKRLVGLGR
ncbi:MAG TPA: phytanoyl-CoA dioxygenase family protein [Gemmataceae bacterium]|nr:phytanoyl-CoA dioxygenase family protein [Gemmataceae bacterium]